MKKLLTMSIFCAFALTSLGCWTDSGNKKSDPPAKKRHNRHRTVSQVEQVS